jgi:hypothetical protein
VPADEPAPPLRGEDILTEYDWRLLQGLRDINPRVRAMHPLVLGLFVSGESEIGEALRKNIVRTIASSLISAGVGSWQIAPPELLAFEQTTDEVEAIALLAQSLIDSYGRDALIPELADYFDAIVSSFRSLGGLEPQHATERLFSVAENLDALLDAALPIPQQV